MGDVRGRWSTRIDDNNTQNTLESAGGTALGGHREHMTKHIAAALLLSQPTLMVVPTSAATSPDAFSTTARR